jgi:hypothetical protein
MRTPSLPLIQLFCSGLVQVRSFYLDKLYFPRTIGTWRKEGGLGESGWTGGSGEGGGRGGGVGVNLYTNSIKYPPPHPPFFTPPPTLSPSNFKSLCLEQWVTRLLMSGLLLLYLHTERSPLEFHLAVGNTHIGEILSSKCNAWVTCQHLASAHPLLDKELGGTYHYCCYESTYSHNPHTNLIQNSIILKML